MSATSIASSPVSPRSVTQFESRSSTFSIVVVDSLLGSLLYADYVDQKYPSRVIQDIFNVLFFMRL